MDFDNEGTTPVNLFNGSFNNLPDGPERFHREPSDVPLPQHPRNIAGFNYSANATAHDPMLGSEADQLPLLSRMTPYNHVAAGSTLSPRAGNGSTAQAVQFMDLSGPDYHDDRSSTVTGGPIASPGHQLSGPELLETEGSLVELDELPEVESSFASEPTDRQLGIDPSVDRRYQLDHFHSSFLQPASRSAFANPRFDNGPGPRNVLQAQPAGFNWPGIAYNHDQAMQYGEQGEMPSPQRFLPPHESFHNQTFGTLGNIGDVGRAYPIYSGSQLQHSAEQGLHADAHERFAGHRVEETGARHRSLQNRRASGLGHATIAHNLYENQPGLNDDASRLPSQVLLSVPPAYAQWRPFDYARYGNRLLVEAEAENHAARSSRLAQTGGQSRSPSCKDPSGRTGGHDIRPGLAFNSRLPGFPGDYNPALQGNRNNHEPYSWPQHDDHRRGRANSYFTDATQQEQPFYDDEREPWSGYRSNQPFLPSQYQEEESDYSDDGEVSYATHMKDKSSLLDYDDREYQDDQEPAKRRKTTSGYTPQPIITHRASSPKLASQVGSGRTSPYRRTRGSHGECPVKGFGGQRKWWSRTHNGGLEVRRKKQDPWVKAVYHYQIRQTLLRAAGNVNRYVHPRASGPEAEDQTSYLLIQKYWGLEEREHWTRILDNILTRFEPKDYTLPDFLSKAQGDMMFRGRVVVDVDNRPVIDWPLLPATLSSQFEGGYMEALLRLCPQMATRDFWARMPKWIKPPGTYGHKSQLAPTFSALNMRDVLKAKVVNKMSQEDKDNNTTENVFTSK
ncbi:hypothetical protein G7Y79_00021g049720 [Physcia stellaris]|nr:hypothetical protein G7Y79_00021g049720 [Physcia stellaris]